MLKGFKFKGANGIDLSIVETDQPGIVVVSLHSPEKNGNIETACELLESDFKDLCELRYIARFKEPPEEIAAEQEQSHA